MRWIAPIALLLIVCFIAAPAAVAKSDKPKPHDDKIVKAALARFKKDYADEDMDKRLQILKWLGMHRHKKVASQLRKIWLNEPNVELKAGAAEGLGNQISEPSSATKTLLQGLKNFKNFGNKEPNTPDEAARQDLEAAVLVCGVQAVAKLSFAKSWDELKEFINHNHDDVAIATIRLCGEHKEYRSLKIILEWFHFYPDGLSWSGGSVKVDTGAAGNKDANAAKAKWKGKYGGRAKKGRPKAFEAMMKSVKEITGQEMNKADELKDWMKENKLLLKKHGA